MSTHVFVTFLVLLKFLLSIVYLLSSQNVIFKPWVEFVGHDLTTYGNCSAESKFELIKHWPLPPHAISLLSFIELCRFYSRYCPWFETNIKPLRKLQWTFYHQPIPLLSWNLSLIALFNDCKNYIVSSLLLLWHDRSKPSFIKINWSAGGMGYILMQADDSSKSVAAIPLLEDKGECTLNSSLDGPRLWPVFFDTRSSQPFEIHYHSFISEFACGRWAISCCRKYL